ncbi:MAG: flagellar biosynthesis anti-sigma factor FlgM [Provencibacterium sp.]|jgi:anti-sigma28 factor (negative regulator of flagellin synthesis)|nr:flagellar biosynthesis anti-sigma factor FlgM [Provencibacterium sp.]
MSINFSAMNKLYGVQGSSFTTGAETIAHRAAATGTLTQAPEKTDVISISPQGNLQREIGRVSKSVMAGIRQTDAEDSARIDDLRAQIENHTYHVPTDLLANAILGREAEL